MSNQTDLNPSEWDWLQDTYWYVLPENLSALRLDLDSDTLAWVIDQTVWHITGYKNGYFWGVTATMIIEGGDETQQQGSGSTPVCFTMLGSITPQGRVHLTFIPSQAASSRTATIGIGRTVRHRGNWSFQMQMSSGNRERTAHWAYMTPVQQGDASWDSLPGVGLSVPQMLAGCEPPQIQTPGSMMNA